MHALTYTERPGDVFSECHRVLRSGGHLLAVTLASHSHTKAVEPYNHRNLGFKPRALKQLAAKAGLEVVWCGVSAVEKRKPNFSIISLHAVKR
jgi:ArsR family transcriptional regulator